MAARTLKPHHQEDIKAKIQSAQLVKILQDHAVKGGKSKFAMTRIRAAEILLARSMPTLSAVEQTLIDPSAGLGRDQLIENIKQLLVSDPSIAGQLGLMVAPVPTPIPAQPDVVMVQPGAFLEAPDSVDEVEPAPVTH